MTRPESNADKKTVRLLLSIHEYGRDVDTVSVTFSADAASKQFGSGRRSDV
jgi:hypothetical protein